MHLATGHATAKNDGEFVIVSIPSGDSFIEIAMSRNNAIAMAQFTQRAAMEEVEKSRQEAEVVAFRRRA